MKRIKISKRPVETDVPAPRLHAKQLSYRSYQIDVPGIGRLKTGENHPDFHITDRIMTGPKKKTKKPIAAARCAGEKDNPDAKMEIAHSRP